MATYNRLILARDAAGTPVVVSVPTNVYPNEGDLCIIDDNTVLTVEQDAYMNAESDEMAILAAVATIYEADAVYHKCWEKEKPADAPTKP